MSGGHLDQVQNLSSIDPALIEVATCASDLYLFSRFGGQVLFLNSAGKNILGLTEQEAPGCLSKIFDPQDPFIRDILNGTAEINDSPSLVTKIRHFTLDKLCSAKIKCINLGENIVLIIAKDFYNGPVLNSKIIELEKKLENERRAFQQSDKKYKETQEVAKLGSWYYYPNSQEIVWSDQMFQIFPEDQKQGPPDFQSHRSTIYHEDLERWDRTVSACEETGRPFDLSFRVVHKERGIVWVRAIGRGEFGNKGEVVGIYGTCQDITEQKRNQELQELVLEKLKIGIWQWNITSDEFIWGRGMASLYGLKGGEQKTSFKSWKELIAEDCREEVMNEVADALATKDHFDFRFKINFANDGIRHIRCRGKVERDANGRPFFAYGMNYDITKEILVNEKLEEERAKIIHSSKLATLGEMAAGIAHEINNPLTIISGNTSIIDHYKERPETIGKSTKKISKSVERISRIINGLRKFSRQSDGMDRQRYSAYEVLAESVELASSAAKMRKIPIKIKEFEDFEINCDEVQIQQVFVNLLTNALDAQEDESDPWIEISAHTEGSYAVFEIYDAGKGVSPSVEGRLFNPFFTTKKVGKGTGLGLSISKGIAQDHGGDLSYSLKNGHTCFTLSINNHFSDQSATLA